MVGKDLEVGGSGLSLSHSETNSEIVGLQGLLSRRFRDPGTVFSDANSIAGLLPP